MRKLIEFQPSTNNTATLLARKPSIFEDLVLKEDYRNYRHRFESGKTKIRLLPTIGKNNDGQWSLQVPAIQHPGGRHAHPRTITPGAKSVFDGAYEYMKENYPNRLFSKTNKTGIRLLPSPAVACWAVVQDANGTKLRLLLNSDYDGSRGGATGLGHIIQEFVNRYGSNETVPGHPLNPADGVSLLVERIGGSDTKFPSYRVSLADDRGPLQPILEKISEIEHNSLVPLEETIRILEPEEEWRLLSKLIGDDIVAEVRSSQAPQVAGEEAVMSSGIQQSPQTEESPSVDEAANNPDDYKDFPSKFNI